MDDAASQLYSAEGPPQAGALRHGRPADVRTALVAVRARTLALADDYAAALGPQLRVPQRDDLNPPLWELGHVAWFQEWWVGRNRQRRRGVDADPDAARPAPLLPGADAWYDSGRVAHASRWSLPLPDADGTRRYLAGTLAQTLDLLDTLAQEPAVDDRALYFFRLVALHEAMHAEAATYMARTLGIAVRAPVAPPLREQVHELALPAGRHRLGSSSKGFAFDNELQAQELRVEGCRIDADAVSWARYLPFIEAGGYEDAQWWQGDGLRWLQAQPQRLPRHLRRGAAQWEQNLDGRWQPMDLSQAAIHLTAHEAEAWCRWAGRRLPDEFEWEAAALTLPGFLWGAAWEWTASHFAPFPGFVPHPYRDYSQPWFQGRRVLRGACPATSPWLAHARYRNFFPPQRNDIVAGFRSCRSFAV